MRIVVVEMMFHDLCRLWGLKSNEEPDNHRFCCDLGGLLEAKTEAASRSGIMSEGEVPLGLRVPVLLKRGATPPM